MSPLARLTALYVRKCSRLTTSGQVIPEVDGLRFIAILAVLLYHCQYSLLWQSGSEDLALARDPLARVLEGGAYGVHLFFVISGFILALPFARHALRGEAPVSLGRYYRRRLTRLEPPYLLCLAIFFALKALLHGQGRALFPHLLASSLYLSNVVFRHESALNGVSWSLEIEVQFYVLMPLLAAGFAVKRPALRRSLWVLGALAFSVLDTFAPVDSLVDWTLAGYLPLFLVGLLLADLYVTARVGERPGEPAPDARWDVVAIASLAAVVALVRSPVETLALPWLLFAFCWSVMRGRLRGLLRLPWISTTGGMCYSIYLIHDPFFTLGARLLHPAGAFPVQLAMLGAVALPAIWAGSVGYFVLVERPCMDPRWPSRLAAMLRG